MTNDAAPPPRSDARFCGVLGLGAVLLHLPFLTRYGYHGDELYFLSCGARPDLGYVDHAPLVPLLAALVHALDGGSLLGLRILACLAGATTVVLTALLCRELGGRRFAMGTSALGVALAPFFLRTANQFAIPSFEPVYWTLCTWILVRLLQRDRPALWLAFGATAGIGLLNKHTMLLYGFAVVVGLLLTSHRRQLATRWPWLGAAVALCLFAPNLLWQIAHGWPTLDFAANLNRTVMARISRVDFLMGQVLYSGVQNTVLWIPGLVFLLTRRRGAGRLLGIAFVAVLAVLLVLQSKIYYSLPVYPVVLAAGAWAWETWLARARWPRIALPAFLAAGGLVMAPISVPALPIDAVDRYAERVTMGLAGKAYEITGDLHAMYGWPEEAHQVMAAYIGLPDEERRRCVLLVGSYMRAGALELYVPGDARPPILCNHMSWHSWSRSYLDAHRDAPRNGDVALAHGLGRKTLESWFQSVEQVGVAASDPRANRWRQNSPLYLCREPRAPTADLWPGRPSL